MAKPVLGDKVETEDVSFTYQDGDPIYLGEMADSQGIVSYTIIYPIGTVYIILPPIIIENTEDPENPFVIPQEPVLNDEEVEAEIITVVKKVKYKKSHDEGSGDPVPGNMVYAWDTLSDVKYGILLKIQNDKYKVGYEESGHTVTKHFDNASLIDPN